MDQTSTSQRFGLIKQRIVDLKQFTSQLNQTHDSLTKNGGEFEIQQLLDDQELYVKQVPSDSNMVFRAFSDSLYFSQSRFQEVKMQL
jgi:hypothetical protein